MKVMNEYLKKGMKNWIYLFEYTKHIVNKLGLTETDNKTIIQILDKKIQYYTNSINNIVSSR